MKLKCPNDCPQDSSSTQSNFRKDGVYFRKSDSKTIQRYRCRSCGKSFSRATFSPCYRQKKRRVNEILFKLLSPGVSMRRAAISILQDATVRVPTPCSSTKRMRMDAYEIPRIPTAIASRTRQRLVLMFNILQPDNCREAIRSLI